MARLLCLHWALVAALLVGVVCAEFGGVSRTLSADSATVLHAKLVALDDGAGNFGESWSDTDGAVRGFVLLKKPVPHAEALCSRAKSVLKDSSSLADVHHALRVHALAKCKGAASIGADVATLVSSTISDAASFVDIEVSSVYHAVSIATTQRDGKPLVAVDSEDLGSLVNNLLEMRDADGSFLNAETSESGSIEVAGYALQTIATIVKNAALSDEDQMALEVLADCVEDIVELGEELKGDAGVDAGLAYYDEGDSRTMFRATASFLNGLVQLKEFVELDVPAGFISSLSQGIVTRSLPSGPRDIAALLEIVDHVTGPVLPNPLVLSLLTDTVSGKHGGTVSVRVSDLRGKAVSDIRSVKLVSAESSKSGSPLITDAALKAGKDGQYDFDFLARKPEGGAFACHFAVDASGKRYEDIDDAERSVLVLTAVKVSSIDFELIDLLDKSVVAKQTLKGKKRVDLGTECDVYHSMVVRFNVINEDTQKSAYVQQAVVHVRSADADLEVVVPAARSRKGEYEATINLDSIGKVVSFHSGHYDLKVLVADSFVENPVARTIGSVALKFIAGMEEAQAERRTVTGPREDFDHVFRTPEKRPPAAISSLFTTLSLAPLLVLFVGLLRVGGLNLTNLPNSGFSFIAGVGFVSSVSLSAACLYLYWLSWNMFQTAGALAVLGIVGIYFGKYSLRHRMTTRLAKPAKRVH